MDWEYIKDKVLVFGEDDYVFSNVFVAIISEHRYKTNKDLVTNVYLLLQELMHENLIEVFILKTELKDGKKVVENLLYKYENNIDVENFIKKVDEEWASSNYRLPEPNELFWITTNENGKTKIKENTSNGF